MFHVSSSNSTAHSVSQAPMQVQAKAPRRSSTPRIRSTLIALMISTRSRRACSWSPRKPTLAARMVS